MTDDTDRINALERLPRRRQPARDLWPGIESRLAPRRSRLYPRLQLALAASLVAALAAVFTVALRDDAALAPLQFASTERLPLTTDSRAIVQANLSLVRGAERELQQALRQNPDSPALRSLLASAENRQRALRAML